MPNASSVSHDFEALQRALTQVTPTASSAPEVIRGHTRDCWPAAAKVPDPPSDELPSFVVRPNSRTEAIEVVRLLSRLAIPLVPYGGGSNVVGAIQPTPGAVILDTRGLNALDGIDRETCTVFVEAGAIGQDVEKALNSDGYTLGHYPQSMALSTVGGWISTFATGTFSTGYGGIEHLVEAIDVVLANGKIVTTQTTPRSSTGPRLASLFIGAEATFGLVLAATLKARPIPESRRLLAFKVPSVMPTLDAIRTLLQKGVVPASIRLYNPRETSVLADAYGFPVGDCLLLLALDGPKELVAAQEALARAQLASVEPADLGEGPARAWYDGRYSYDWFLTGNGQSEPIPPLRRSASGQIADAIEVSVSWNRVREVLQAVSDAIAPHADDHMYHLSHFYPQGACIYFIFSIQRDNAADAIAAYNATWDEAMAATLASGGSIAHHHGIGRVRRKWLRDDLGESGYELLTRIKRSLDPDHIMNPGAFDI